MLYAYNGIKENPCFEYKKRHTKIDIKFFLIFLMENGKKGEMIERIKYERRLNNQFYFKKYTDQIN